LHDQPSACAERKLLREILRYLVDHPDAKDTREGIHNWWLPGGHVEWENEEVQAALDLLIAKGWLTKRETSPAQTIYGLHKERVEEITRFLNSFSS
jgi:hypothetical protein